MFNRTYSTFCRFFSSRSLSPHTSVATISTLLPDYRHLLGNLQKQGHLLKHKPLEFTAIDIFPPKKILDVPIQQVLKSDMPLRLNTHETSLHESEIIHKELYQLVPQINSYITDITQKVSASKKDAGAALLAYRFDLDYSDILVLLLQDLALTNTPILSPLGTQHEHYIVLGQFLASGYVELDKHEKIDFTQVTSSLKELEKLNNHELAYTLFNLIFKAMLSEAARLSPKHDADTYFTETTIKKLITFQVLRRLNQMDNEAEVEQFVDGLHRALDQLSLSSSCGLSARIIS